MTSPMDDREELDALADLIATCHDSARVRRLDVLTYQLDMAFVAARSDPDAAETSSHPRPFQGAFTATDGTVVGGFPVVLELSTIRTTVLACRDRAEDIGRSTLVYMLDMALVAIERAIND